MIRRVARRVRSALAARLVPFRQLGAELLAIGDAKWVIARTIGRTALHTLRRTSRERPFRIAIDIRPYYEPLTGIGWYQHHLMDQWSREGSIEMIGIADPMITDHGPDFAAALPAHVSVLRFDLRGRRLGRMTRTLCAVAYPLLVWVARADVHFAPNYTFSRPHSAVASPRVIAVHDLTFRRHPELLQRETLEHLERSLPPELQRADAILCVSTATRDDLAELFGVSRQKARVVLSGLGNPPVNETVSLPDGITKPYALFVSTIEPRKNVSTLVAALERAWDDGSWDGQLVLAGRTGWKSDSTLEQIHTSRWSSRIKRLEYVDRATLSTLYRHATMFVFPSLYEGFGFPLLEAMAHGVPCVTSSVSSLPEVGGDAAVYVDPRDEKAIASAILALATDDALRRRLSAAGVERAASFTWERAAAETLAVLRHAAGTAER